MAETGQKTTFFYAFGSWVKNDPKKPKFYDTFSGVREELTSCITLNVLLSDSTMFELSNAVSAERFAHRERFLRHFENHKILAFLGSFLTLEPKS